MCVSVCVSVCVSSTHVHTHIHTDTHTQIEINKFYTVVREVHVIITDLAISLVITP